MTKTPAHGTKMAVKINGNYVNIPGLEGVPEFGPQAAEYENTAIDDEAKTFGKDLPDPGDMTITGSWDSKDTSHDYLMDCATNGHENDDFQVTYKSGAKAQFLANIMSFRTSAQKGKDEAFSSKLKLTGSVNYTAAT